MPWNYCSKCGVFLECIQCEECRKYFCMRHNLSIKTIDVCFLCDKTVCAYCSEPGIEDYCMPCICKKCFEERDRKRIVL